MVTVAIDAVAVVVTVEFDVAAAAVVVAAFSVFVAAITITLSSMIFTNLHDQLNNIF